MRDEGTVSMNRSAHRNHRYRCNIYEHKDKNKNASEIGVKN